MASILNQNIPKKPAKVVIQELKTLLYQSEDMLRKFISEEKENKYQMNFNLFNRRNSGGYINLEESQELLLSIGQPVEEDELQELFDELKDDSKGGINFENIKLIIAKKIRDKDTGVQMNLAFALIAEACIPEGKTQSPSDPKVHTDMFKEMLMTMGLKLDEG